LIVLSCKKTQKDGINLNIDPSVASGILASVDTTACGEDSFNYPQLGISSVIPVVPDSILNRMSTCGLVNTCFNFTGDGFFTASNNIKESFYSFSNNYEVLIELRKRNDFVEKIISNYAKNHISSASNTIRSEYIDLILAQDSLLLKLDNNQIKQLIVITFDKINRENQLSEIFGVPYSTHYILARLMIVKNYQPFIVEAYKNTISWGGPLFQEITLDMENIGKFAIEYFNSLN
jgi:hypothetical protein